MLNKARWIVKETKLRLNYMVSKECIFCKIVKGEIKSKLIAENDNVIVLNDINPVAKVHILIVPKKHIESVSTVSADDGGDLVEMFMAAIEIANKNKLSAYRLSFNAGRYQHIGHLHMHLLAGSKIQWNRL